MAVTPLREVLKTLIEKSGLDTTDAKFADVLSTSANIDESVGKQLIGFLSNALTVESAKNNWEIESHFKRKSFLPLESEIKKLSDEYGLGDDDKTMLDSEQSTYKKIPILLAKVAQLKEQKSGASSGDKKVLQEEINNLNKQILDIKTNYETKLKEATTNAENQILEYAINAELGSKTYSEAIPEAIRVSGAREMINKELATKGLKIVRGEGNKIKLVQSASPDLTYMENNKEVSFSDFATSAVRPMLKVSESVTSVTPTRQILTDTKISKGAKSIVDFNLQQAEKFTQNSMVNQG